MPREEGPPTLDSNQAIERDATYDHVEHGRVRITDIWHGTRWVDSIGVVHGHETAVVRFLPPEGDNWQDELTEPLPEFLEAIE